MTSLEIQFFFFGVMLGGVFMIVAISMIHGLRKISESNRIFDLEAVVREVLIWWDDIENCPLKKTDIEKILDRMD